MPSLGEFLSFSFPETYKPATTYFTSYLSEFDFPGRGHLEDLRSDLVFQASKQARPGLSSFSDNVQGEELLALRAGRGL